MFDRFIRLAQARKALREQRFEEVLGLCADPMIRADRRAEALRREAIAALLARARRHVEAEDLPAARADARRLAAAAPGAAAEELCREIDAAAAGEAAAQDLARRTLAEARAALDRGETAAAAALLATVDPGSLLLERKQLEKLLAERALQAEQLAARVGAALDAGDVEAAVRGLDRVRALDRDAAATGALTQRVVTALAERAAAAMRQRLAADDVVGAAACLQEVTARLSGLDAGPSLRALRQSLTVPMQTALRSAASLDEALELVAALRGVGLEAEPEFVGLAGAVVRAAAARGGEDGGEAARRLREAAVAVGADGLARAADRLSESAAVRDQQLVAARRHIDRGDLDAARVELLRVLTREPDHGAARRELVLVDQGLADLAQRLENARAAARSGRLREACSLGLSLVGNAGVGADAQQLVAEVRNRMSLVDRGIDEVRVALHGRLAAGAEGVRHCLRRLQELAKVQIDHDELPVITRAVEAEIEALGHCEAAAKALEQGVFADAAQAITALQTYGDQLLTRDRLDARVCGLADRLLGTCEQALATGRLGLVERCAGLFALLQPQRPEYDQRARELLAGVARRQAAAQRLVAQAEAALQGRDLAEAERLVDAARGEWDEAADVRRLVAELEGLRRQQRTLDRVEVMAKERDFVGAQQKLATMPPTQAMLRTRIYDMKQDLARAQGLTGAFLLRVDEGGEHLVLRGESVSIGNVRQRRSDLPVLASLAGRHASLRRSMSFHGGMQDTIVAEEGEVRVGGAITTSRPLHPGDRVQLGAAFTFVYQRSSERSLSASLLLQSGFQVAGTDRVLLMKDRGRDGRLLLGPGRDVHVRVPRATGEVEVYAASNGQMRVHCAAGGTIDGAPFRGEHPVAAGQVVEAAGISFLMYPWHPGG
ncbi:MAG: hypothetical protein JNM25_10315 [Planctomycetes bacterium]|nr:hypothetical protein [Planctomycetota bacterium]